MKTALEVINQLMSALEGAEARLNSIPHNYDKTDFKGIRKALKAGDDWLNDEMKEKK
jgi:hypothetical protein